MERRDLFFVILITFIWGLNFVIIRIGIDAFPPIMFSAVRFTLAAIPLVFFLPKPKVSWQIIVGIGLVLGVIKFTLLFVGMDVGLSAGLASLVLQSQAFFTVILAAMIYRDRPTVFQVWGITIAFVGIGLVATTIDTSATLTGLTLVIGAGFAWAVSNLLMKRARAINMLSLMVWVSLIPPIPLFLLSLSFEGVEANVDAISHLDVKGIGAIIYISYLATIVGFAGWGKLIHKYGAGRVAPFSLLVPIFGMGSSAVLLDERFGPIRLIAVVLIIIGLVLTILKPKTSGPIPSQSSDRER